MNDGLDASFIQLASCVIFLLLLVLGVLAVLPWKNKTSTIGRGQRILQRVLHKFDGNALSCVHTYLKINAFCIKLGGTYDMLFLFTLFLQAPKEKNPISAEQSSRS